MAKISLNFRNHTGTVLWKMAGVVYFDTNTDVT